MPTPPATEGAPSSDPLAPALAPAALLALAARVEGDGRYNVAKLLRAPHGRCARRSVPALRGRRRHLLDPAAGVVARAPRPRHRARRPRAHPHGAAGAARADPGRRLDRPPRPREATTDDVLDEYLASRQAVLERLRMAPAEAWGRTGRHREFGRLTLTQQVSYFAAHEPTHLRQVRASVPKDAGA